MFGAILSGINLTHQSQKGCITYFDRGESSTAEYLYVPNPLNSSCVIARELVFFFMMCVYLCVMCVLIVKIVLIK